MLAEKIYLTKYLTGIAFHPRRSGIMGNGLQGKKEINQQSDELIQWWEAEDFFMH